MGVMRSEFRIYRKSLEAHFTHKTENSVLRQSTTCNMNPINPKESCAVASRDMSPSVQISANVFHPISTEEIDSKESNEGTYISFPSSCFSSHTADTEVEMEFTPYPYTTTIEELKDWQQLEFSFGEDWSLRLACELSSSEDSIDSDCGSIADESLLFQGEEATSRPEDEMETSA